MRELTLERVDDFRTRLSVRMSPRQADRVRHALMRLHNLHNFSRYGPSDPDIYILCAMEEYLERAEGFASDELVGLS